MRESEKESLDGSSIKPVSSLRSHFEQMSGAMPNVSASNSGSILNGVDRKCLNLQLPESSGPVNRHTEERYSLQFKSPRNLNPSKKDESQFSNNLRKPTLSPPGIQQRSPPFPPSSVTTLAPSSPSSGRLMSLKLPKVSPDISESSNLEIPSFDNAKSPGRPQTPSIELSRPGKIAGCNPPSPPPPRRIPKPRYPAKDGPEKPKISSKPVSLVLKTPKSSLESKSPKSTELIVSQFPSPPSANIPINKVSPSSFSRIQSSESPGATEKLQKFPEKLSHNKSHLLISEEGNTIKSDHAHISPHVTGNQPPALPVRTSIQVDSYKTRNIKNTSQSSNPFKGSDVDTTPKNIYSNSLHSHTNYCSRQNSIITTRNSDNILESLKPTTEQLPDFSLSNRRPPCLKDGARDISIKFDTRIMDVCGEFVCTSGHLTRIWNLYDGEIVASFVHTEGVKITSIAFKPAADLNREGFNIWLGNNIGDILEIDVISKSLVETRANAHARHEIIRMHRHYHDMWTLDNGGTLNIWAADTQGSLGLKNCAQSFRLPKGHTFSMVVGNELWLATGKELRVFLPTVNASSPFQVLQNPLSQPNTGDITSGTTNGAQNEKLYFGHADGKVSIYSKFNYTCLNVVSLSVYKITAMTSMAGNLWTGFSTGVIFIYDVEQSPWVVRKDWSAHQGPVIKLISDQSSCWSLDRAQVVTLGQDNILRVWDGFLENDYIESQMRSQEAYFSHSKHLSALIMTWNAGASTPFILQQRDQDSVLFRDLILGSGCPDILVFGFQELVDLEDKKTVTKSFFKSKKKDSSVQEHMSHQYRDWRDFLIRCLDDYMPRDELYHLLHTATLVGLFTCVFVKAPLINRIRSLSSAEVKRGLGGFHGNKGAIIVRFIIDDTSMCFVNCHLTAGQNGTRDRNTDITAILESSILPSESDRLMRMNNYIGGGDGSMIFDHEICIVNGDLNYRIDTMSRDTVINAIKAKNINKLLERDQLLASKKKNPWFKLRAFQELPITFAPTYKYDIGTDTYDTSEKKRSPAWCDRILYRGGNCIEQLNYRRHEIRVSDHRPVTGYFQISVKSISPEKRALKWDEVRKQHLRRKEILINQAMQEYLINILGCNSDSCQSIIQKYKGR